VIKKALILLNLLIILVAAGNEFSIHKVQAESLNNIEKTNELPQVDPTAIQKKSLTADKEIPNIEGNYLSVNDQLKRVSEAIQENNQAIVKVDTEITAARSDIENLENEIRIIKENMAKRNEVLKERALSYQQSDKHADYLEVLLGATSLSDLVDRVSALAAIAEADRNLLEQQEIQQKEYESKKLLLENKLVDLNSMKNKIETMQAHLNKQQEEYETLQNQLELEAQKKETAQTYINASLKLEKDYISTVINAGNKYIGNSVYVYGGGRNANDISRGRFDCSGFVHWAFSEAGINISSTTSTIKNDGSQVSPQDMQPGDIVFFDTYKRDGHVGIYLGNGEFIGSQSSTGVAIADMTKGYWKNAFKGRVIRI